MDNEVIMPLEKNKIQSNPVTGTPKEAACCGGTPIENDAACCRLDEQKKAEGEAGCGCNTAEVTPAAKCC